MESVEENLIQVDIFIRMVDDKRGRWIRKLEGTVAELDRMEPSQERRVMIHAFQNVLTKLDRSVWVEHQILKDVNLFLTSVQKNSEYWIEMLTQDMIRVDGTEPSPQRKKMITEIQRMIDRLERRIQSE